MNKLSYENLSRKYVVATGQYVQPNAIVTTLNGSDYWISFYRNCLPSERQLLATLKDKKSCGCAKSDFFVYKLSEVESVVLKGSIYDFYNVPAETRRNLSFLTFLYARSLSEGVDFTEAFFYN